MNRIKEILKELNMTQEELAFLTGIDHSDINKIANGKKIKIHLSTAAKISVALKKPVEYIFPDYFKY